MIKGKFRTLSNITDGAFAQKMSTGKSRYLFLQKASSYIFDWVLNASLMVTVASYWESISNKTESV